MDRAQALACILGGLITPSCQRARRVRVGSKNFTEQLILGEILAQHIERTVRVNVRRSLNLGGTLLAQQGLITNAIDLYPEYTGTALTAILRQPPQTDPKTVRDIVGREYRQRFNLTWLDPFGFNNTFAMVVRGEDAKTIRTLTEAADARAWRLGVGYEFLQRPDGYTGLVKTYGLRAQGNPVSMDLGLLYTALRNRQVDMVAANSTDGMLSVLEVTVLEDDRHYFPPYECAAVTRDTSPDLIAAINGLAGRIDNRRMRELNYAIDGQHRPLKQVAAEFLDTLSQ